MEILASPAKKVKFLAHLSYEGKTCPKVHLASFNNEITGGSHRLDGAKVFLTLTSMLIIIPILIVDFKTLRSKNKRTMQIVSRILIIVGPCDPTKIKEMSDPTDPITVLPIIKVKFLYFSF